MGTLIVVDCEAPFGVGAPSVGDMTDFGAVDFNALRDGRTETFHGTDCSEETFRQFREWLAPRMPVVFVSDNPGVPTSSRSTSTSGATSARTRSATPADASPISTRGSSVTSEVPRSGNGCGERSTTIILCTTRSATPRPSFDSSTASDKEQTVSLCRAPTAMRSRATELSGYAPALPDPILRGAPNSHSTRGTPIAPSAS